MDNYDEENLENKYDPDDETPLTDFDAEDDIDDLSSTRRVPDLKNAKRNDRKDLIDKFAEPQVVRIKEKPDYKPLLLAVGLVAVIIIAATCSIVYNIVHPKLQIKDGKAKLIINEENSEEEVSQGVEDFTDIQAKVVKDGVIQKVDTYENSITFVSLEDNKTYSVKIKGSTFLKDRYNNEIMLSDFKRGETVTFVYDKSDRLAYVMKSSGGFETTDINIAIDADRKIITDSTNNAKYFYDDKLTTCYKDSNIDLDKIAKEDTVTIMGYKETIYYINVTSGHGVLEVTNKDKIKNGTIDIDKSIVGRNLKELSTLNISEGHHNIVVKGDNCEVFVKDIEVEANTTFTLDLSEVQIKQGVLLIKANVSDYLLYINNNIELSREPLILDYGAYSVRIEKEGYKTYEEQFVLDKSQRTIDAKLEENIPMGKLTVNTTPDYAEVYVDNTKVGISPLTVQVPHGNHNLTVRKEGYKEVTFNGIEITNVESQYNITLQSNDPVQNPVLSDGDTQSSTN